MEKPGAAGATITNNGYMLVHGGFNTESINNSGANADIFAENGILSVSDSLSTTQGAKFRMLKFKGAPSMAYPVVNVTGDIISAGSEFSIQGGNLVHKANGAE